MGECEDINSSEGMVVLSLILAKMAKSAMMVMVCWHSQSQMKRLRDEEITR